MKICAILTFFTINHLAVASCHENFLFSESREESASPSRVVQWVPKDLGADSTLTQGLVAWKKQKASLFSMGYFPVALRDQFYPSEIVAPLQQGEFKQGSGAKLASSPTRMANLDAILMGVRATSQKGKVSYFLFHLDIHAEGVKENAVDLMKKMIRDLRNDSRSFVDFQVVVSIDPSIRRKVNVPSESVVFGVSLQKDIQAKTSSFPRNAKSLSKLLGPGVTAELHEVSSKIYQRRGIKEVFSRMMVVDGSGVHLLKSKEKSFRGDQVTADFIPWTVLGTQPQHPE